jgi:hypothetical protein
MRAARLSVADASLENVWCDPARGIDKSVIRDLGTGKWIRNKQNVILVGKTGVGKTSLGAPRSPVPGCPPERLPRSAGIRNRGGDDRDPYARDAPVCSGS